MAGTLSRSFAIVGETFGVLRQDKELMVFPLCSGIITLLIAATFFIPLLLGGVLTASYTADVQTLTGTGWVVLLFVFYLATSFVVVFFNTALIGAANIRLSGGDPTVSDGISIALRHVWKILPWAVVTATVGLVLHLVAERSGVLGRIAVGLVGGVWSLVTFFVIPVIIFEEKGVVDSVRESWDLFKRTWGENVIGQFSIGVIFVVIGFAGMLLVFLSLLSGIAALAITAVAAFVLLLAVIAVCASALQGIFVAAMYRFAKTGEVPAGFDRDHIEQAFAPKKGKVKGGTI